MSSPPFFDVCCDFVQNCINMQRLCRPLRYTLNRGYLHCHTLMSWHTALVFSLFESFSYIHKAKVLAFDPLRQLDMSHGEYRVEGGAAVGRDARTTLRPCPVFLALYTTGTLNLRKVRIFTFAVLTSFVVQFVCVTSLSIAKMCGGSCCMSSDRGAGAMTAPPCFAAIRT